MARGFFLALLVAASAALAQAPQIKLEQLPPETIQERLKLVSRKMSERRSILQSLFDKAGCSGEHLSEQPVRGVKEPNIICTLESVTPTASTIIVGGHWDFVDRGWGAVDDWSGAVLLPSLYQSLKGTPRRHRFVFVAFAAEERGLVGSRKYVGSLSSDERKTIHAMINLECLGLSPPEVWARRANERLLTAYTAVARSLDLAPIGANVDRVGEDDSLSFLSVGVPVLTIHSLTTATFPILHSPDDDLGAVHANYYYAAYRLAAAYLAYLDGLLE